MSKQNNLHDFLLDLANTIREKKGTSGTLNPQNFSDEIESIETGKPEQSKSVTITENGSTTVLPDSGKVLSSVAVTVDVPSVEPVLQEKTVTANGVYTPDTGYDGFSKVTVAIPVYDGEVE